MKKFFIELFLAGVSAVFLSCSNAAENAGSRDKSNSGISDAGTEKNCTYTVEHYKETLEGSFSSAAGETEALQGKESSDVIYTPKNYPGFTYDSLRTTINGISELSDRIAADGSTVVCLYYTRNIVTLTFSPSGGVFPPDFSGGVLSGRYGDTVTAVLPEKAGSTFSGWEPSVPETFPPEDSEYTAVWESEKYPINYNLAAGGINGKNPAAYTVETETIILSDPARDGYAFDGWYDSADFSGSRITQIEKGSTGTITLYAKWTAEEYTVTFHPNGSSGAKYTREFTFGTTQPLPAVAYTRKGYTFTGWNTDSKGTGIFYADGAGYTTGTADGDLYALWEIVTYDIIYVLNGGTNASINPPDFTVAAGTITLSSPLREGYTFIGWYTNSDFSGSQKKKIPKGTAENITLYAKWSE
jgi:uncharacterized repeat protein (TIGR02543 family)